MMTRGFSKFLKFSKMTDLNHEQIKELAKKYGTPLYIFEEKTIRRQCKALKQAVSYPKTTFRYACKALSISAVLKIVKEEGFSIDASSYNEVLRAVKSGFKASDILYTGEGADITEFKSLLELGVNINCSSLDQMRLVGAIKTGSSVSIRFNPGEGHGHSDKVNTGGPNSKHGIYYNDLTKTLELANELGLKVTGVHTHIGSGTDLEHWLRIKDLTLELAKQIPDLETIDLGGGLPVVYREGSDSPMPLAEWGSALTKAMNEFSAAVGKEISLELEPGRFIVAECGSLLSTVQGFKETPEHHFAIVNSGFNHNPRPVLYGAYHPIEFISMNSTTSSEKKNYVVAGNLCESGDVFTVDYEGRLLPREFQNLHVGDLMLMGVVGAYSYSMMSEYNSMNLPASVLIRTDGDIQLIERRGTFEDLLRREVP